VTTAKPTGATRVFRDPAGFYDVLNVPAGRVVEVCKLLSLPAPAELRESKAAVLSSSQTSLEAQSSAKCDLCKVVLLCFDLLTTASLCHCCQISLTQRCNVPCAEREECPPSNGICGHTFHFHCIAKVLRKSNMCPSCGAEFAFGML
jgi:anaphase-promoting complex subunit 11